MRKILITNDDGIFSDGIVRLARTALKFGEVWVVAPDSQRSVTQPYPAPRRRGVEGRLPGSGSAGVRL